MTFDARHSAPPPSPTVPYSLTALARMIADAVDAAAPGEPVLLVAPAEDLHALAQLLPFRPAFAAVNTDDTESPVPLHLPEPVPAVVVAADVLDRVTPAQRAPLAAALLRASRTALIVAGPMNSRATAAAVQSVDDMHRASTDAPHPRAGVQLALGLPEVAPIELALREAGAVSVAAFSGTSLRSWALFEMLATAAAVVPNGAALLGRLHRFYNQSVADEDHAAPHYRTALLVQPTGAPHFDAGRLDALRAQYAPRPDTPQVRTARTLLRLVIDAVAESMDLDAPVRRETQLLAEVARLTETVQQQAARLRALNEELLHARKSATSPRGAAPGLLSRIFPPRP